MTRDRGRSQQLNGESMMSRWMDDIEDRLERIERKQDETRELAVNLKFLFWTAIVTGLINVGTTAIKLILGATGH